MRLTLRNDVQVALWKHEIRGQISDGAWENARPDQHWVPWCKCEAVVGPNPGRDFDVIRDIYFLNDRKLLQIIGERMIRLGRLARVVGEPILSAVLEGLSMTFNVPPAGTLWSASSGWPAEVRDQIGAVIQENGLYSREDLILDLREVKRAMRRRA